MLLAFQNVLTSSSTASLQKQRQNPFLKFILPFQNAQRRLSQTMRAGSTTLRLYSWRHKRICQSRVSLSHVSEFFSQERPSWSLLSKLWENQERPPYKKGTCGCQKYQPCSDVTERALKRINRGCMESLAGSPDLHLQRLSTHNCTGDLMNTQTRPYV